VTVKDLIIVKGKPTRRGSRTTDPAPSEEDGPPVARMRQHGGVFLGVQSRSEVGWIASEAVWLICPRLTDRFVGR